MARQYVNSLVFAKFYQEANQINDICTQFNMTENQVRQKASMLRKKGFQLKRFPSNNNKIDWETEAAQFNQNYAN